MSRHLKWLSTSISVMILIGVLTGLISILVKFIGDNLMMMKR